MAITANSFSTVTKDAGGVAFTTFTLSHTVNAGSNSCLWVGVVADTTTSQAGITVSSDLDGSLGAAVSTLAASGTSQQCNVYRRKLPTVGTHVLTITKPSNAFTFAASAVTKDGVDQTTPDADFTQDSGSVTTLSATVPNVVAGNLVIDFGSINGNPTVTIGANQNSLVNANAPEAGSAANGMMYVASDQAGSDGGAMTWTWAGAQRSAHIAFRAIADAGGAGATPHRRLVRMRMGVGM